MITPSICHWATKAVHIQARPPAWRSLLNLPASMCRYEAARLNSAASSRSDKQGQAALGSEAVTEKAAPCSPTNRLPLASCFLSGSGPMFFRENYNIHLPKKKKKSQCLFFRKDNT